MPEVPNCPLCGKLVAADNVTQVEDTRFYENAEEIKCDSCDNTTIVSDNGISLNNDVSFEEKYE